MGKCHSYIDHTHVPDITKIKCKEFVNEVKEVAKTSQLTTHVILGVVITKVCIYFIIKTILIIMWVLFLKIV